MKIRIRGIEGYDGDYDFEPDDFSQREVADIEALAGVPFGKWTEGYLSVMVAIAAAVLKRAGKPVVEDMLWNAKVGAISIPEGDAVPPAQSPTRSSVGGTTSSESSGTESTSASQDKNPPGTGDPGSESSVPSDRLTLAS